MADPYSAITGLVMPAATARFVLLVNHVLTAAPVAPERLKPHSGRVLRVDVAGWPAMVPPPPPVALRITPAGLFEAADAESDTADLRLTLDASQPLEAARRLATGQLPPLNIEGDVGLAADVNWVIANVRWDLAADLERLVGPVLTEGLSRASEQAREALRTLAQSAAGMMRKS